MAQDHRKTLVQATAGRVRAGFKPALAFLVPLLVYRADILIVFNEALKSEIANYLLAVPFLLSYMVYRKRKLLRAVTSTDEDRERTLTENLMGLALCLSALFLYAYGSFTFYALEYHLASLPIFVAGCTLALFNYRTLRALIFPIAFLSLLITPPWKSIYEAGARLSVLTSNIAYHLLKLTGLPVKLSYMSATPAIIVQSRTGQALPFTIDVACAGIYSLIGFFVFALFAAYIAKGTPQKKGALFLTGFILIYALNVARVLIIVMVGYWWGFEAAMGLLHALGGSVLIFLGTLALLLLGEKALKIRFFDAKTETRNQPCPVCEESQQENEAFCLACGRLLNLPRIEVLKRDVYKVLALATIGLLIVNLQLPAFVLAGQSSMELDLQKMSGDSETQLFLPALTGYEPTFLYRDTEFEKWSKQDAALLYAYYPENRSLAPILVGVEIADSYSKLHRWELCLFLYPAEKGWETVIPLEQRDVQILGNPPLVGRFYVFRPSRSTQTVVILYWYERAAFKMGSGWGHKYVKTSLIAYADSFARTGEIESPQDYSKLEDKLYSMAQTVASHWEPAKAWSPIVILFAQWGQALAAITILFAAFMAAYRLWWREGGDSASLYKQLVWYSSFSKEEKETLDVVETLTKTGESTGKALANAHRKLLGKTVKLNRLIEILKHAEESGLVERDVIIVEDRPVLVWKSRIPTTAEGESERE